MDPHQKPQENDAPATPLWSMVDAAVALHELYVSYCKAGFTRREALGLCKTVVSTGIRCEAGQ